MQCYILSFYHWPVWNFHSGGKHLCLLFRHSLFKKAAHVRTHPSKPPCLIHQADSSARNEKVLSAESSRWADLNKSTCTHGECFTNPRDLFHIQPDLAAATSAATFEPGLFNTPRLALRTQVWHYSKTTWFNSPLALRMLITTFVADTAEPSACMASTLCSKCRGATPAYLFFFFCHHTRLWSSRMFHRYR